MKQRKFLSVFVCLLMVATVFVVGVPMNVGAEEPGLQGEWWVEGNSTYFELTNSTYLNVTLTSSENVYIYLESVPRMINYYIVRNCTADFADIILTGFEPSTTYYRYQDGDLQEEFTTSESGSYSYTQDISEYHHVYIQEITSTLYISYSYTFTGDIYDHIVITKSYIVIDGNGYTLHGPGSGIGIYISGPTVKSITIKNINIIDFTYGIYLTSSHLHLNTIIDNTFSGNRYSIYIYTSDWNTISGNTIDANYFDFGIYLRRGHVNTISSNTITNSQWGLYLYESSGNNICNNVIKERRYGIYLRFACGDNIISGNTISYLNLDAIYIRSSDRNLITDNIIHNCYFGVRLWWQSWNNIIKGNDISKMDSWSPKTYNGQGIHLGIYGQRNNVIDNFISMGKEKSGHAGIFIYRSTYYGTITGNTIFDTSVGIRLGRSTTSITIFHNQFINNNIQYQQWGSLSPSTIWDNGAGEGNYWSDYIGLDDGSVDPRTGLPRNEGDGIGDTNLPHQRVDWYPLMGVMPNTEEGTDVEIHAGLGVEMIFQEVTSSGFTYVSEETGSPPPNFKLVPLNTFYDISTTASFDGFITISIPYDPTGIKPQKQDNLKLKHWNEVTNQWDDCTLWVDTENNIIYGETTSLSIFAIMYENKPPVVMITGPPTGSLYVVGTSVEFTGSFTDDDTEDTHTAQWTFTSQGVPVTIEGTVTESEGSGTVTDPYTFTETGVYLVKLTVWDNDDGEGTSELVGDLTAMVVIYDPEGGFVTGGGWIDSPEGAYEPDPFLSGKASFGFVAKYKKGASEPIGNTEFKFEVAELDFHSTHYDWLVIGGARAIFKGAGTINEEGEYKFKLWAVDGKIPGGGEVDKFRIKIWEEDEFGVETVIYDNKEETELGGGQIMIHKA